METKDKTKSLHRGILKTGALHKEWTIEVSTGMHIWECVGGGGGLESSITYNIKEDLKVHN